MRMELPLPLARGAVVSHQSCIILATADGLTEFAAPRAAALRLSRLLSQLLLVDADNSEDEVLDGAIPVNEPHCDAATLARFVLWLQLQEVDCEACKPPPPSFDPPFPLPPRVPLESVLGPTDLAFIDAVVVPGGDMRAHAALHRLACLAIYLDVPRLLDVASAYTAWQLQKLAGGEGGRGLRGALLGLQRWFEPPGDALATDELASIEAAHAWCDELGDTDFLAD